MSDRFKFRVWDKGNKRYQGSEDWQPYLDTDGDVCFINIDDVRNYPPENTFIIEQCTGLKDENGNLIYEGDIVSNGYKTGVVKYGEFNCSCCDGVYGWYFDGADIRDVESYKIIGNIHEQAEQKD